MFEYKKISWSQTLFTVVLLGVCLVPASVIASLPCGDIIAPVDWDASSPLTNTLVTDCSNPFNKTVGVVSPYILTIEGVNVSENDQVVISEEGTINYVISGYSPTPLTFASHFLFKYDGNDYRYVDMDELTPTEADIRRLATEFFGPGVDIEPYMLAMLSDDPWNYFPDGPQQDLLSRWTTTGFTLQF